MIAMCKAMRELANGNFDVVLRLGRSDELGEMAARWKSSRCRRSPKRTRCRPKMPRTSGSARAAPTDSLADDFEAAVGSIVSNVSASAVSLNRLRNADANGRDTQSCRASAAIGRSIQNMLVPPNGELFDPVNESADDPESQISEAAVLSAANDGASQLSRAAKRSGRGH